MADKNPGIHGEGLGTGLPNDGDYSDTELKFVQQMKDGEVLSTEELIRQMEMDELEDQADEVTKLPPREYGKLRGIAPQLVYYHMRQGRISKERCICGRTVIDIDTADQHFKKGKYSDDPRSD